MDNEQSPQHKTQKQQNLEQHEVQQVLEFIKRYGKLIMAGAVAATVAVLVSRGFATRKADRLAEAEQMLMATQTPTQLEEVINTYPSTPTAQTALLTLAKTLFNDGDIAQARANYERFIEDYGNSEQRAVAEFGLAYCIEAENDFSAAADAFAAFQENHPGHFLIPTAILAQARCFDAVGDTPQALTTLQDFLAQNPTSPWAQPAEAALERLTK